MKMWMCTSRPREVVRMVKTQLARREDSQRGGAAVRCHHHKSLTWATRTQRGSCFEVVWEKDLALVSDYRATLKAVE